MFFFRTMQYPSTGKSYSRGLKGKVASGLLSSNIVFGCTLLAPFRAEVVNRKLPLHHNLTTLPEYLIVP